MARGSLAESRARKAGTPRRGFSIIYVGLIMFGALGFVSIAVDMGRLRVARVQLSTAADAAALAGALKLPVVDHAAVQTDAKNVAAMNNAIQGTGVAVPVVIIPSSDIEIGLYRTSTNPPTFTKIGSSVGGHTVVKADANAVHVTALRTKARNNTAVGLFFARALGPSMNEMDVKAEAIALARGARMGFGIVGIDWVHMNGNTYTDSYNAAAGPYGGSNIHSNGTVASNGPINLVGTSDIWGDARPGVDDFVSLNGNATVHGWTAPLDEPLDYPPDPLPGGLTQTKWKNLVVNKTATLNGSNNPNNPAEYWLDKIDQTGKVDLVINGYVKVWVSQYIDIGGGSVTNSPPPNLPAKLLLVMIGSGTVDLGGNGQLFAHVYAPQADVRLHGTGQNFGLCGWVIGKTLDIKGNSPIHYDESLPSLLGPRRAVLVNGKAT